jgi:hypothetical protein
MVHPGVVSLNSLAAILRQAAPLYTTFHPIINDLDGSAERSPRRQSSAGDSVLPRSVIGSLTGDTAQSGAAVRFKVDLALTTASTPERSNLSNKEHICD